ncbi:MAG: GtrA family protein [Methanophagales archaeon]|nr:GtrA family protein [Methanophagales archaeon]
MWEKLASLRKDFERLLKFSVVGAFGALINSFFLWLFTEIAGIFYLFSSLMAIEIAIFVQFMLNDRWTFHERRTKGLCEFFKRILKSNIWRAGGIALNIAVLFLLTEYAHIYYLLSNIFGILCAFISNYILESRLTWGVGWEK